MSMNHEFTQTGFDLIEFTDIYGERCNVQISSLATTDAIWLGVANANPIIMKNGTGWVKYPIPEEVLLHTRMHIDKPLAKELIRILTLFVENGEIYESDE